MELPLLLMTIGYAIGSVFVLTLALFILAKAQQRRQAWFFFLMSVAVFVFQISHVVGVNIADPELSRLVFLGNMANIFIAIFMAHWIVVFVDKVEREKLVLILIYVIGLGMFVYYIMFPETFLKPSEPQMYLPSYRVAGDDYWIMRVYFAVITTLYVPYLLFREYFSTASLIMKNRIKYVATGIIFGVMIGSLATLLTFGINIDPIWSAFFPLYAVPIAYAVLKYELLNIKIVAKRALIYAVIVAFITVLITSVSVANEWVAREYPEFSFWFIPLIASIFASLVAYVVWWKIREVDLMKYEFVTVVTHKFQTPLTQLKWGADNLLLLENMPKEGRQELRRMQTGIEKLIRLTYLLTNLSATKDGSARKHIPAALKVAYVVSDVFKAEESRMDRKNIKHHLDLDRTLKAYVHRSQLEMVLRIVVENAVTYTPKGGSIAASFKREGSRGVIVVEDTGVGISPKERPYLFDSFFRGSQARKIDTEGLGTGLFMAKEVIEEQGGTIRVRSEGIGHGTQVIISLPLAPEHEQNIQEESRDRGTPQGRRGEQANENTDEAGNA